MIGVLGCAGTQLWISGRSFDRVQAFRVQGLECRWVMMTGILPVLNPKP